MARFHAFARPFDDGIRGCDDVLRGTIIVGEENGFRRIVFFKLSNVSNRGARECVNILFVIAHRKQADALIGIVDTPPSDRRNERIFFRTYVLAFVHQYLAIALYQDFAHDFSFNPAQTVTAQEAGGIGQKGIENWSFGALTSSGARTYKPHCKCMDGQNRNEPCIVTDKPPKSLADLGGRMTIIGKDKNSVWVLAFNPDKLCDLMHQDAGLAGTRTREDKDISLLAVVADNLFLRRVAECFDDVRIRLWCRLPPELCASTRHPPFMKSSLSMAK